MLAPNLYLNAMLAEPFEAFTFSPASASVYQLGSFGTARKELKALDLTPQTPPLKDVEPGTVRRGRPDGSAEKE